ncbi:sensor histidine kinase [Paenibacillus hamazuiensis]|uniref:sensor histidine kinase n=1 Tax=Paenibacillus hamazuiensis TaxID=2936508 RepID=UPI00200DB402|nr:sensor histidine kinase [Paenibacillus hamazuiensis]
MNVRHFQRIPAFFRKSKLSTIMVACFIFLNLLFLTAIIWIAYNSFSAATFEEISRARLALLNESTKRGFDFNQQMTGTALTVVSNKDIVDRLAAPANSSFDIITKRREISDLLHHFMVITAGISSIEIYTDRFNEVPYTATDLVYPIAQIQNEEWFGSLGKADAIWVPIKGNASPDSLIGYVQHIFNGKGETIGYVFVRMSKDDVLRKFADVPLVLEGQVLLVDAGGHIVLTVNGTGSGEEGAAADEEWIRERSASLSDGVHIYRKGARSYLVLFSKPSTLQWRLVQMIPTDILLAGVRKVGGVVLGIGGLILLVSALFAFLFVRNMITPLRRLMMEMKKLERGDFAAHATSSFTEEYGQLSVSFNHMVARLRELMDSVKKESKAKRDAETSLLEAQIKPHFLYNTLDMIHWRALDYKAEDISLMTMKLGKMLRIGLSGGKLFIRVRDELEHACCYISIQQERLPFPIDYKHHVEPRVRSYYIPKVILQPIIENSVIHGKSPGTAEQLRIRLEIREVHGDFDARTLEMKLTDNGRGLPAGWDLQQATGIGLRNVQKRIELYCGPRYGLRVAGREDGPGVEVTIRLPVIETEEQLKRLLDGEDS